MKFQILKYLVFFILTLLGLGEYNTVIEERAETKALLKKLTALIEEGAETKALATALIEERSDTKALLEKTTALSEKVDSLEKNMDEHFAPLFTKAESKIILHTIIVIGMFLCEKFL